MFVENNIFEIFNNIKCPVFVIFLFVFILCLYLNNYYAVYSHIPNNNNNNNIAIQEIIDQQDKIKVQFAYDYKKININTLTDLTFSVLNSTTNEHIKNFLARVVVTEGQELFGFDTITVSDGDFSVKHSFTNYGSHQILLRADTNSTIIPASFEVFIPLYTLNPDFTTNLIIGVGVPVSVVMTIILLLILKKK